MQSTLNTLPAAQPVTKPMLWTGRVLSALSVLFLIMDGAMKVAMKVVNVQPVVDTSILLGLPVDLAPWIGAILLVCVAVYLVPRTAFLGAVLLTGFLGGAVAIQARVDAGWFSLVFPIILGAMLWGGLALRDKEVRSLLLRQ